MSALCYVKLFPITLILALEYIHINVLKLINSDGLKNVFVFFHLLIYFPISLSLLCNGYYSLKTNAIPSTLTLV